MTIYEIKTRVAGHSPHFFDRDTLKFWGQTMRSFKIKKQPDGRYMITAPIRGLDGSAYDETKRFFNPKNNRLEFQ